jgi:hypothetical protein
MALPLVLRDYRRVGAQSGDLSLGVVMGDTQRPSHEERLITPEELCAPDNPDRSVFTKSALDECARWVKSKSRSGQ